MVLALHQVDHLAVEGQPLLGQAQAHAARRRRSPAVEKRKRCQIFVSPVGAADCSLFRDAVATFAYRSSALFSLMLTRQQSSKGMDSEIDAKTFWKAIGCRAIGVAIVTAKGSDGPAGFLALSATHLSASPPMMMVSIGLTTSALGAVRESNHFAINYVPKGADALVKEFAGQGSLKGADRFLPGAWGALKTGAPTLVDSVGVIDCRLDELIERHGTVIALGRVVAYSASTKEPLISFRGGYL